MAAVVLFAGCGGGDEADTFAGTVVEPKPLRPLTVTLDGYSGPENVGILMADEQNYFRDAGLKVEVLSPARPNRPVEYTTNGVADIGISREPEVAIARSEGTPVVAIGSLVEEPTAALIWLGDSGIKGVADLKGKTISTAGLKSETELLGSVLRGAGLSLSDVKVKNVGYGIVPSLLKGRADATFAGWNLQGIQLETRGLDPVITKVQDLGVPPYDEFVVITRRDRLAKDPELYRDFMAAVVRGSAKAIEDPDLAFEVVNEDIEGDIRVTSEEREAQVEATLPLLSESGEMDTEQAGELVDWMRSEGMIKGKLPVSSLLTNDYLPRP